VEGPWTGLPVGAPQLLCGDADLAVEGLQPAVQLVQLRLVLLSEPVAILELLDVGIGLLVCGADAPQGHVESAKPAPGFFQRKTGSPHLSDIAEPDSTEKPINFVDLEVRQLVEDRGGTGDPGQGRRLSIGEHPPADEVLLGDGQRRLWRVGGRRESPANQTV